MPEYIDRGVALDLVATEFGKGERGLEKAYHEIFRYPAADVRENVKGEWDMDSVAFYRKCPNCKCCVRDNRYEVFLDNGDWHYCPNCGGQMR